MTLANPSREGDSWRPGDEPLIAEGVRGVWFDKPDAVYLTFLYAVRPGSGDVGRMLDNLPKDRKVIVPTVLSGRLDGMLRRRNFQMEMVRPGSSPFGEPYFAMVRSVVR